MAPRIAIASTILIAAIAQPSFADEKDQVQAAIKAGQKFLIASQRGGGPGNQAVPALATGHVVGSACLTGLALIESGLPADDPVIVNIARGVRQVLMSINSTYEISLMVMFLDRVGQKADQPLIQFLTLRLMFGQGTDGAWSYTCNLTLNPVEERALFAELTKDAKLVTPDTSKTPKTPKKEIKPRDDDLDGPRTPKKDKPETKPETKPEAPKEDPKPKLHPALEPFEQALRRGARSGGFGVIAGGDHSNTQFATVGLWCGRRHGVDVSDALVALDKHYRGLQGGDGGWSYSTVTGGSSSPAMTCAGLMGLAMGFGAKNLDSKAGRRADPDEIAKDKAVEAGLKYVGDFIAAAGALRGPGGPGFQANELTSNLYFMWSLERVGMVYGLTTIGKVDWYDWGSKVLVASQQRDGSWRSDGFHSGSAENSTAFALLFLTKANLAEDLASSLKGKVKDPGSSRLRSPGDLNKLLEGAGKPSTGPSKDPGTTARPKGENPSTAETDKGGKLAAALIAAEAAERAELLKQYRDTKGGEYTDALARAAAKMTGEAQTQTREALATRLTRMTSTTLNDLMRDRDRELRRGAALAAAAKGKERFSEFSASLIRLVADDEAMVSQAARATLKSLTGQDFGPESGAGPADRGKALVAWRNWLEKNQ